jgi:alpha-glucosidase
MLLFKLLQPKPTLKKSMVFLNSKKKKLQRCRAVRIDTILQSSTQVQLQGYSCNSPFRLTIRAIDLHSLDLHFSVEDSSINRVYLTVQSPKDELIYGMGEQYSYSNLKGKKVPIWVEEQGIGAGDQPISTIANLKIAGGTPLSTYAPIPFYISSEGYSVSVLNSHRSILDFRQKHQTEFEVWDQQLSLKIRQYDSPLEHIKAYTAANGRLRKLPDWAWGTIVGLQGGRLPVQNIVDSLLKAGSNLSAIWVQDWVGRRRTFVGDQLRWYWQADTLRYPRFKEFCAQMHQKGIAVLGYINPMLSNDGVLYQEADQKGYLVKNHLGKTYVIQMTGFRVGLIDLTNPDACRWIKSLIKDNMIAAGLRGWMADFGEALPWDAVLYSGISAEAYHNLYPIEWARVNREAIEEAGKMGEIAFFSRSSFTGGSNYSTFYWAGDQMTSWQKNDGLRSIVPALTSSGICGMSINHADVGAFAGFWKAGGLFQMRRGRKLLKRHIELGSFSPIFRTHEGILPARNLQVYSDTNIRSFYARFSQIRAQLLPYLKQTAQEAYQKGYPMARHLYLHYPDDIDAQKSTYQFLLGPSLLVAPKLVKGGNKQRVYLPEGQWQHIFSKKVYQGTQYIKIKATLGTPPVFVKYINKHLPPTLKEAILNIN